MGDVLLVSHVSAKEKFVIIHKQLANEPLLSISLEEQRNELDEVIIKEQPDITVQSVGIVQENKKFQLQMSVGYIQLEILNLFIYLVY